MKDEQLDFYCSQCDRPFRGIVFSLDRAHERTEFIEPMPKVDIIGASAEETFCSSECLALGLPAAMLRQQVPIPAVTPDIGPVEVCAICSGPVDMAEWHLAYSMSQCQETGTMAMQPLWYEAVAVVCNTCRPPTGAAAWAEPTVKTHPPEAADNAKRRG